ncbi:agmatinase [Cladophialophora bantiana CBS 173.52]|uniref:Agmatinase n=1 Tax=Cladophialophora bantiana (strain ATCC 10958 / CBS 173.52 / CDC B-1940 / NIH 8579) TaxID=1442370 RepID=A0A0D2HK79_CLAB1|nr:agmatinase [Cladophialophora bantiana CBS 173.52]KIW91160.1 agmatinase [Cladophialophora bantiana CBS 173.52]
MLSSWTFLLFLLPASPLARDIVFPPVSPLQANLGGHAGQYRSPVASDKDPLVEFEKYAGLTTFANLPWVHCLSPDNNIDKYDIAFLGAPFDTGTTARPGARFGPTGIRWGSRRIQTAAAWDPYTHENTFLGWARIVDCGDAPLTFLDNTVALQQLEKAHKVVSGRTANTTEVADVPRIITLGGDHTTTLAALRSTIDHWGPVSVIHFDSHIDTWDPKVLGGGISHYAGLNHGTFLHIAHEEGLILNSSAHAGIRAPVMNKSHDWKNDKRCGFEIITARAIDKIGVSGIIEKLKARVGDTNVYVSVDIDVLDPAYAPATGTAEVGGWTTRELLSILDGLEGLKIVGADVVEVAPIYDNPGETTVLAAGEVAHRLMSLMVETPVKPLKRDGFSA